jgi:hypothetical protein
MLRLKKPLMIQNGYNFEQARRVAEWKRKIGSYMAFIADNVINQLEDTAPEIGDKLWAVLKTQLSKMLKLRNNMLR